MFFLFFVFFYKSVNPTNKVDFDTTQCLLLVLIPVTLKERTKFYKITVTHLITAQVNLQLTFFVIIGLVDMCRTYAYL